MNEVTVSLEYLANGCALAAGIRPDQWVRFTRTLWALHEHNAVHYYHSLRVGLYAYKIAAIEGQRDLKYPLFAGFGHDIGKCGILNEVLNNPDFGPEDYEVIKAHPRLGFEQLKDSFLFTSFIAGLHHKFQPEGYGIELERDAPFKLSERATETVLKMTHLVMICDFFDALTTRADKFGGREVSEIMYERFPDQKERVDKLFEIRLKG